MQRTRLAGPKARAESSHIPPKTFRTSFETEGIEKAFKGVKVLRGIAIRAPAGQVTGIIGPNGAGKSTLLDVIGGLLVPDAGRIFIDGLEITSAPIRERARCGLVRTFQIPRVFGELTVLENMLVAGSDAGSEGVWQSLFARRFLKRNQRLVAAKASDLLHKAGLLALADASAKTLSGGQRKLLELLRAVMVDPRVILLDEPAAGVSPGLRIEIAALIDSLKKQGKTIVIIEHDMDLIAKLCDRVFVIAEGRNLIDGPFRDVVGDKRVIDAYLGGVA